MELDYEVDGSEVLITLTAETEAESALIKLLDLKENQDVYIDRVNLDDKRMFIQMSFS